MAKAPKPCKLTEEESFSSFTSWKHNIVYIYSLLQDKNLEPFLKDDCTWGKLTADNLKRDFTDKGAGEREMLRVNDIREITFRTLLKLHNVYYNYVYLSTCQHNDKRNIHISVGTIPMAVDAVYFNGGNKDGYFFVSATARRQKRLIQTLTYCRIPGLGLLELPSLPDTCLYRDEELSYATSGLKIEPLEPMKKWKISYDGKMRLIKADSKDEQELVTVKFDLDWTATSKCFDFDTDLNTWSMCGSMAREKWTRQYFDMLKEAHQTHYEQFGDITGTIHIEEYGDKEIKVQGVRDHSYGNIRNWADLHRYAIQYLTLEDGTKICVGNICFPKTMTRLIIGYVMFKDGRMDSVSSTDLELHTVGEDGNDPDHIEFSFYAGDRCYHLKADVLDRPKFYMGYEWEARIHERMCMFEVNGVKGWGISEWDYRNHTGRPDIYKKLK